MKLGIETTQEKAEVSSPLLVYRYLGNILHSTSVDFLVCGNGFNSLSNKSNKSKCYPTLPGAWVPANADTHAEPLYI